MKPPLPPHLPGWIRPTTVTAATLFVYLTIILIRAHGDPLAFVVLGDGFRNGRPVGEPGYDGQFAYYMAIDPAPASAATHLDDPAYRYQRILLPLLARILAVGQAPLVPWTLVGVNVLAQLAGTWLLEYWLKQHNVSHWYALPYGLWAGLLMAVRLDLNEPLALALCVAAVVTFERRRPILTATLLLMAVFAKETSLLFVGAAALAGLAGRRFRLVVTIGAALVVYAVFQGFLFSTFGVVGLRAGGFTATPVEWIPYMGLWRIGGVSMAALGLYLVMLGPSIVLPSAWGIVAGLRRLWQHDFALPVWVISVQAGFLPFTPFSTFREPLGIIRLAAGLVLGVILFGAHVRSRRVLNYSLLWLAALVFLLKE